MATPKHSPGGAVTDRVSVMQTSGEGSGPQYPIESVDRALRLLKMFRDEPEIRLLDARAALDVGQSTAHRLLAMLCHHGFAVQDPRTRVYRAGPALLEVGLAAVRKLDLRETARPHLMTLAQESGETIHLANLEGTQVRFIDAVESAHALRVSARVGRLLPAQATSIGKAMLAALDPEVVEALFRGKPLESVTAKTITDWGVLAEELDRVRSQGFATNDEESEEGVGSVGVSVTGASGRVLGGLSISAPRTRLNRAKRVRMAGLLREAADQIAADAEDLPSSA